MSGEIKKLGQLVGKVIREGAEVIMIFKVGDKYYPATDENCEVMDAYMHTGDEKYLTGLTGEVQL